MSDTGSTPPSRTLLADLDRFLREDAAERERPRAAAVALAPETVMDALDAQILAGLVSP